MSNDTKGNNPDQTQQEDNQTSSNKTFSHSESSDSINLDEMASHLKSLEQKLAAQPDIDQAHVDRIRNAISSGEFRIDPERVANKMLNSEDD